MSARIPPAGEDLNFARSSKTRRVHILPWTDPDSLEPVDVSLGEALTQMILVPRPVLCGRRFTIGSWPGAGADYEDTFPDDDLCAACVRALGDQQVRAFENHYGDYEDALRDAPGGGR